MNANVEPPVAAPEVARRPHWQTDDHEFLPAALEIIETPPSPVRIALLLTICLFVAVALVWAWFGRIDIIAVAQGKVQPEGAVKIIQPLETGKVMAVLVKSGGQVKAGDVLVRLDPSEADADLRGAASGYWSFRAEVLRRQAGVTAAQTRRLDPLPVIAWPVDLPEDLRQRERQVLQTDLAHVRLLAESASAQKRQKEAEAARLRAMIEAQKNLIAVQKERVDMRDSLVTRGAGARTNVLDALESLRYQETVLATDVGQLAESLANIEVLDREIDKAYENYIAENSQKTADAQRQADDYEQRLARAKAKLDHLVLTSPIDGTVLASSPVTIGQVVSSGAEVLRVVPSGGGLEIECYLPNRDFGFVQLDQEAVVKLDAFPFNRYGSIMARVTRIAQDSIPEPDAQAIENNPAAKQRAGMFASADRTQNLVFAVTLKPGATSMKIDGFDVPLTPGMSLTAEIKTGDRRILEYIFSPLVELSSKALKER